VIVGLVTCYTNVPAPDRHLPPRSSGETRGSTADGEDLVLEKLAGVTGTGVPLCVAAGGSAIDPDGSRCEPGTVAHGQSASFVITTKVTGKARQARQLRMSARGALRWCHAW
jgi:hypothetical protein